MRRALLVFLPVAALAIVAACSSDELQSDPSSDPMSNEQSDDPALDEEEPQPSDSEDPESEDASSPPPEEDADAPRFVDTCKREESVCTAPPAGFKEGSGLSPIDRCAFALEESAGLGTVPPLVTALEAITTKVSVADVLADANRTATRTTSVPGSPAGVAYAFRWQNDDDASTAWIPQGITGTVDAAATGKVAGKTAVLVSLYHAPPTGQVNKGVRIAFVDTTVPDAPKYRFVLLVQPKGTPAAPTFDPVRIHAGGIVWFGDFLYVADTSRGFRVFDTRHILRVATDQDVIGCTGSTCRAGTYKYVLPQVGTYQIGSACQPRFSFVSLDRQSDPPALVSGEYCSTTACTGPLSGRVYRWPLDPATRLLRSKTTFPTEAYLMSHKQIQGAAFVGPTCYLSSSAPPAGRGELNAVAAGKSRTWRWIDSPEDVMLDHANGRLWSLSEEARARVVFAASLSSYPKP